MTEEDFAIKCPVCQFNCNCKRCLRLEVLVKVSFFSYLLFVDLCLLDFLHFTIEFTRLFWCVTGQGEVQG